MKKYANRFLSLADPRPNLGIALLTECRFLLQKETTWFHMDHQLMLYQKADKACTYSPNSQHSTHPLFSSKWWLPWREHIQSWIIIWFHGLHLNLRSKALPPDFAANYTTENILLSWKTLVFVWQHVIGLQYFRLFVTPKFPIVSDLI